MSQSRLSLDSELAPVRAVPVSDDVPPPGLSAGGFDPSYLLRVIHRRRWPAGTLFALVLTGATIHTLTTVPIYEARVRAFIEMERLNILKIEDILEQDRSMDAQIAVLQSRWLAKQTMEALHLLQPAAPTAGGPAGARGLDAEPTKTGSLWSGLAARIPWVRSSATPPASRRLDEAAAETSQIDAFLAGLTVTPATKGVLDIKYRSSDPVLAARIANGVAQQYIAENLEMRFAAVKEVTDWLAARLAEQREKVNISEQALQRFREQNQLVIIEGTESPTAAKLNELTAAMTRARTARLDKEALLNKALALRSDPVALQHLPQMTADPAVQQLRTELDALQRSRAQMAEKLQDPHPDMIKVRAAIQAAQAKLQAEMGRVIQSMRDDVAMAAASETGLASELEGQRREAIGQNRKSVELGILEREAQSSRQIYDMLVQRARETNIAKEIRPSQIRILDAAEVPRAPILPQTRQQLLIAVLIGLTLAVAAALGLDRLDNRVKTPDEVKTRLGLPFLGLMPEVRTRGSTGVPIMTNGAPPMFVEAVRGIRTNLLYSFADESLRTIVVTSTATREGKTVVASNLAIALAQAGQRVLLIDADMRRPAVHQLFTIEREPGLSNLLVGAATANDVVQRSSVPNLYLLPSGHRSPNPAELLGSRRFKKALSALSAYFDWVVLDAPPVMPVTDACVLSHMASGVLFVVGAERVSRQVARRALEQLDAARAVVLGAVLNRVDIERHPYYYSDYYRKDYSEYFEHQA